MMQLILDKKEGEASVTHRFYPTVKNLTVNGRIDVSMPYHITPNKVLKSGRYIDLSKKPSKKQSSRRKPKPFKKVTQTKYQRILRQKEQNKRKMCHVRRGWNVHPVIYIFLFTFSHAIK